ncbi:MAG: hypothetical protein V2B19_26260 [Pseudomonadota bacterium]
MKIFIHEATLGLSIPILLAFFLLCPAKGDAADGERPVAPSSGLYIELTENFYRALKNEAAGADRIYTNNSADEYLRQIAVSTKFMVETNLQIIRQQEKIIELLESRGKKEGPGSKR